MIKATRVRPLSLASPQQPGFISAASGMVLVGRCLYVVADDMLHLGVFDATSDNAGQLVRLFPGSLPNDPASRKALKPDLETLVLLPEFHGYPAGALLALPSGSRPNRHMGNLLGLDASGELVGAPRAIDFTGLYLSLEQSIPALNIEGGVVIGEELVLLQRGSRAHPVGALVAFELEGLFDAIINNATAEWAPAPARIFSIDLGMAGGSPLCFTDAAALADGRIIFSAVAENTADTYQDGPCMAAAIGIMDRQGNVEVLEALQPTLKIEGIHVASEGGMIELLLVTDADDPAIAGNLLRASIASRANARANS